jgi:hypothetical protein
MTMLAILIVLFCLYCVCVLAAGDKKPRYRDDTDRWAKLQDWDRQRRENR